MEVSASDDTLPLQSALSVMTLTGAPWIPTEPIVFVLYAIVLLSSFIMLFRLFNLT